MIFERARTSLLPAVLLIFLVGLTDCGGSPAASTPSAGERPALEPLEPGAGDGAGPTSSSPQAEASENCAETGCFSCGEGTCPRGSYCDASSAEKSACAWLGDCGELPSCSCLTRILGSSCACEESEGAVRLRCAG